MVYDEADRCEDHAGCNWTQVFDFYFCDGSPMALTEAENAKFADERAEQRERRQGMSMGGGGGGT
jgi:hypothetical protein